MATPSRYRVGFHAVTSMATPTTAPATAPSPPTYRWTVSSGSGSATGSIAACPTSAPSIRTTPSTTSTRVSRISLTMTCPGISRGHRNGEIGAGGVDRVSQVELLPDARAELAEGPCWLADRERLLWVNITAGHVHLLDPKTGENRTLEVGQPVGAAVPADDGRVAMAVRDGF